MVIQLFKPNRETERITKYIIVLNGSLKKHVTGSTNKYNSTK